MNCAGTSARGLSPRKRASWRSISFSVARFWASTVLLGTGVATGVALEAGVPVARAVGSTWVAPAFGVAVRVAPKNGSGVGVSKARATAVAVDLGVGVGFDVEGPGRPVELQPTITRQRSALAGNMSAR